jgi:beta-1,4-N-acetylglucosaminyltransferase
MIRPESRKICLVCSSGGHFFEMQTLDPVWNTRPRFWVTNRDEDTVFALRDEDVVWAHQPTIRSLVNFARNFRLAWTTLRRERPGLIISTGAGVSVPFIYAGRILGIRSIFLESMTRVSGLSLSAKLVYPVVDRLLVQWPEAGKRFRKAEYRGRIL